MKKLYVGISCMAYYTSVIEAPDDYTLEDAIDYARDNVKPHTTVMK